MSLWGANELNAEKDGSSSKKVDKEIIGEFIEFRQLKSNRAKATDLDNADLMDVAINEDNQTDEDYTTRLNRLVQLTGSAVRAHKLGRHLHRSFCQDEQVRYLP